MTNDYVSLLLEGHPSHLTKVFRNLMLHDGAILHRDVVEIKFYHVSYQKWQMAILATESVAEAIRAEAPRCNVSC